MRSAVLASLRGEGRDGLRCPTAPGASGMGTATDTRRGVDDLLQRHTSLLQCQAYKTLDAMPTFH